MTMHRLMRKAMLVVALGVAAQLTASSASAAPTNTNLSCGYCATSCWDAIFGCLVGCQSSGSGGCYSGCYGESGTYYPVGLNCA